MIKKVYILITEKDQVFWGAFGTEEEARRHAKNIKAPTQVFGWHVMFPQEFPKVDELNKATLKFVGLTK